MELPAVSTTPPLIVSRVHPDPDRRREYVGSAAPRAENPTFVLPPDDTFGSAAPVSVYAGTEAAVAELKPVDGLSLAEAIHRYVDED